MSAAVGFNFKPLYAFPLDDRLLFPSKEAMINALEANLYDGIIATYVEDGQTACYQWYKSNDPQTPLKKWRKLETTSAADLFYVCSSKAEWDRLYETHPYGIGGNINRDNRIYLAPKVDSSGVQVMGDGANNELSVWEQWKWDTTDDTNPHWVKIGDLKLKINVSSFATQDSVTNIENRVEVIEGNVSSNEEDIANLIDSIGTLKDFQEGFNSALDELHQMFASTDVNIYTSDSPTSSNAGSGGELPPEPSLQ